MKSTLFISLSLLAVSIFSQAQEQKPEILDVSDVTIGSQKLDTTYLLAIGQWSDSSKATSVYSAEIHCYKRFSFCEVASADSSNHYSGVFVMLNSFDIVRWDEREMIAIESSPTCVVNTLRADLVKRTVTLSSISKGETANKLCDGSDRPTAFLGGSKDAIGRSLTTAKKQ
jgi:hypothetical protein